MLLHVLNPKLLSVGHVITSGGKKKTLAKLLFQY